MALFQTRVSWQQGLEHLEK